MPFIPHTESETEEMLAEIGVASMEDLFDEIPEALRAAPFEVVPPGLSEMAVGRLMQARAAENQAGLNFIGAGAYEHHIPAAVWEIATRGEFYTSYTPYQAEASQGTLQLIYEYQTMMASLTGMDVSNASLYDGATGLAEAVLMAVRANRKVKSDKVLVPESVHPHYRKVLESIVNTQGIESVIIPMDTKTGRMDLSQLPAEEFVALVIPQPNFFGCLEEVDRLTDWAHERGALVIGLVNPVALALLKAPGHWGQDGADIVCGEGQPLGVPLSHGGPYYGLMCTKKQYARQMPGRIVGRTTDMDGQPGFTLTLQAREQHIRRGKATSNICTNQGLAVTASTIFMSILGWRGLKLVAESSHHNTKMLVDRLCQIKGVKRAFDTPFFHEAVVLLPQDADDVLEGLRQRGIFGGYALPRPYPALKNGILVCATETKTEEDIAAYCDALQAVLKEGA